MKEASTSRRRAPIPALAVVAFWRAAGFDRWFVADPVFDALSRMRLGRLQASGSRSTLSIVSPFRSRSSRAP